MQTQSEQSLACASVGPAGTSSSAPCWHKRALSLESQDGACARASAGQTGSCVPLLEGDCAALEGAGGLGPLLASAPLSSFQGMTWLWLTLWLLGHCPPRGHLRFAKSGGEVVSSGFSQICFY